MSTISKGLAWFAGMVLMIGLYFSDNIRGYYRFKEICAQEAGLRLIQPLEANVGWLIADEGGVGRAEYLLHFYEGIAYVRYRTNKDEMLYDLRRGPKAASAATDTSFVASLAATDSSPKYSYREKWADLESESRLSVRAAEVVDLRNQQVAVTHKDFSYRMFSMDWGYGGSSCPKVLEGIDVAKRPNFSKERALKSAFKPIQEK